MSVMQVMHLVLLNYRKQRRDLWTLPRSPHVSFGRDTMSTTNKIAFASILELLNRSLGRLININGTFLVRSGELYADIYALI